MLSEDFLYKSANGIKLNTQAYNKKISQNCKIFEKKKKIWEL